MNVSVRKFAALTSNDFPSTPASFHAINQTKQYNRNIQYTETELLIGASHQYSILRSTVESICQTREVWGKSRVNPYLDTALRAETKRARKSERKCAHLLSRPFVSFFFYPASSSVRSLGFSLENKTMEGSSSSKQTEEWTVEDVCKLIKEQYNEEVAKKFEG